MHLKQGVTKLKRLSASCASAIAKCLRIVLACLFVANYAVWHVLTCFFKALTEGTIYLAVASFYTAAHIMGVPDDEIRIIKRS